jgi:kojibiose phosphorylase
VFEDAAGRQTRLESVRFASMADRDLCALRVEITALNHGAPVVVTSGLDGRRRNLDRLPVYAEGTVFDPEVTWQKWALSRHLTESARDGDSGEIYLQMRTIDRGVEVGFAASTIAPREARRTSVQQRYEQIEQRIEAELSPGWPLRFDKLVANATTRESTDPRSRCRDRLARHVAAGFDARLAAHRRAWAELWEACDCEIVGDPVAAQALRFGIYQLLIAANPDDPTVNIGAKSLTGEGYRGHVFWDTEVLMLPFFILTQPDTARSLLRYRHHTLPAARELAAADGFGGARYPWESADTGAEECPRWTNDGQFRFWTRDEEIHVSADVAYGIVSYLEATADIAFLIDHGAEILFETSRFWVDRAEPNDHGGFSIKQVMGPDEFHSHVDDNAFTNALARWSLRRAAQVHDELASSHPNELAVLAARIGLSPSETGRWRAVADGLVITASQDRGGVIEQFAGYFERDDVPITSWDANNMPRYPEGYHHFNCEETMLLKQPDVVMLLHMLPEEFELETKRANFEFYEARTLHKSSLSPAIHAIMGLEVGDAERALQYFARSAYVDLADNQGNTREGIHIASAGGTWQVVVFGFAGFGIRHDTLTFDPRLPSEWQRIRFRLCWRGVPLRVDLGHQDARFRLEAPADTALDIEVAGRPVALVGGDEQVVGLLAAELQDASNFNPGKD